MNKRFFTLICGCLIFAATMTIRAQSKDYVEQSNLIDSALLTLEKTTDQSTIRHIALNDKEPTLRRLALEKTTDQSIIRHVALNDREPALKGQNTIDK